MMALAVRDVSLTLGSRQVLANVSVRVEPGAVTALVGPNGAGKSSLLRVLCGDVEVSGGRVSLNGRPVETIDAEEQARARSVMSQSAHVAFDFVVDEILRMGWVPSGRGTETALEEALTDVVTRCDIADLLPRTFNTLSGGERQRVQFARALLQIWPTSHGDEPRYLLLDEPTSNLDLAHELLVLRLAREVAGRRIGVLVVLHDLNLAARFADDIVLLSQGRVTASGPPGEVLSAGRLTDVYSTPVRVERHASLERLVIHT